MCLATLRIGAVVGASVVSSPSLSLRLFFHTFPCSVACKAHLRCPPILCYSRILCAIERYLCLFLLLSFFGAVNSCFWSYKSTMASNFAFGSFLSKAAAASPAESFSTASGGVESSGNNQGRVYSAIVVDVDDKCLRLIGRPKGSVCLKDIRECKHEGERIDRVGKHLVVINTGGNAVANMLVPTTYLDDKLIAHLTDQRKSLEEWNKIFNYVNELPPPVTISSLREREDEAETAGLYTKTPGKGRLKRSDDDEDSFVNIVVCAWWQELRCGMRFVAKLRWISHTFSPNPKYFLSLMPLGID